MDLVGDELFILVLCVQEGLPTDIKPFKDDPAKQERFEQFLKDKYHGGLRSTKIGGSNMSEVERAREKLDFEAAAEAIEKGKWNRNFEQPLGMQFTLEGQFVSSALEVIISACDSYQP